MEVWRWEWSLRGRVQASSTVINRYVAMPAASVPVEALSLPVKTRMMNFKKPLLADVTGVWVFVLLLVMIMARTLELVCRLPGKKNPVSFKPRNKVVGVVLERKHRKHA